MPNNSAAVKTYEELRNLGVREADNYFQKFSEFLRETRVTFNWSFEDIEKRGSSRVIKLADAIDYLVKLLTHSQANKKKLMVVGNGGSAGIAMHTLADYANAGGLKTVDFYGPALLTCMSNDYGYENVFAGPIGLLAEPDDMLFAISSSGKSPNIIKACDVANSRLCRVITFSGFNANNPLRRAGYVNFYVPSTHYGFVELVHQALLHCILDLFVKEKTDCENRKLSG